MCDRSPTRASHDFQDVRNQGTGLNTVLSQHFIVSFAPGEITPDRAMQFGTDLCDRFLKGEYQYFLAVHTDKEHTHIHCIFNNVNMIDGRTFETHENQGKKADRSCKKLMHISDELCSEYNLSVIENPEVSRGKSHYEWDMNRQGLSWKAKLKFAIDQTVKESDNFDDFLLRCNANGITVVYNPEHVIDLKFRLEGQQKFTRSRTLGWYYETKQIRRRIDMYKGVMNYTPKTAIIRTDSEKFQNSYGLKKWADIQNMKEAAKVVNILTRYSVDDAGGVEGVLMAKYAKLGFLSENLNKMNTEIEDISLKLKAAKQAKKLEPLISQRKLLSGRARDKFDTEHASEIKAYQQAVRQLSEWFPDGKFLTPESLERKRNALKEERSSKNNEYSVLKSEINELNYARQTLEDYLKNERDVQNLRKKKGSLE